MGETNEDVFGLPSLSPLAKNDDNDAREQPKRRPIPAVSGHSLDCPGFPKKGYKVAEGSIRRGRKRSDAVAPAENIAKEASTSSRRNSSPLRHSERSGKSSSSREMRRRTAGESHHERGELNRSTRSSGTKSRKSKSRSSQGDSDDMFSSLPSHLAANHESTANMSTMSSATRARRVRRSSFTGSKTSKPAPPITRHKPPRRRSMQRRSSNGEGMNSIQPDDDAYEYEFDDGVDEFGGDGDKDVWPSPFEDDPFEDDDDNKSSSRGNPRGRAAARRMSGNASVASRRMSGNGSVAAAATTFAKPKRSSSLKPAERRRNSLRGDSSLPVNRRKSLSAVSSSSSKRNIDCDDLISIDVSVESSVYGDGLRDAAAIKAFGNGKIPLSPRRLSPKKKLFNITPRTPLSTPGHSARSHKSISSGSITEPSTASSSCSPTTQQSFQGVLGRLRSPRLRPMSTNPATGTEGSGSLSALRRMTRRSSANGYGGHAADAGTVVSSISRLQKKHERRSSTGGLPVAPNLHGSQQTLQW